MALYRRGRIWYVDYYANGKRVQESSGTANRRQAEKLHALRVSQLEQGVFAKPVRCSLAEFRERYLAHARTHKRSWQRDEQMLNNLQAFFGYVNLDQITPVRVEAYQQQRVKAVRPATVNRELGLLKHMFHLADRWDLYRGRNPVRLVKFLREDNLKFRTVSADEERALLQAAPPYLQDLIRFAIATGLRRGDIFNLKWEDIDVERRKLNLIAQKTQRRLELPLSHAARAVLEGWSRMRRGPYAFYNPATGDRFGDVKLGLKNACKRAGLSGISWHTFRHTFASRLTRSGVDLVTVKDLLGHSTIGVTMRYAHSDDATKIRAVELAAAPAVDRSDKVVTLARREGPYGRPA